MIVAAHEVLEAALKATGVDFQDVLLDSIEPRRRGELVGFKVHTSQSAEPVLVYVDSSPPPAGAQDSNVLVLADPRTGNQRRVWAYPYDPDLPGLAMLLDPQRREQVLQKLGFHSGSGRLEVEQYVPGWRAVIKVHNPAAQEDDSGLPQTKVEVRLMVINPARVDLVRQVTKDFLRAGVLVPRILAHDNNGILVAEVPQGVPISQVLPDVLGDADLQQQLSATLQAIRGLETDVKSPAGPVERVGWYTAIISELRPDWQPRLIGLSKTIAARLKESEQEVSSRHGHVTIDSLIVSQQRPHELVCLRAADHGGAGSINADAASLVADLLVRAVRSEARGDEAGRLVLTVYYDQLRHLFNPCPGAVAAYLLHAALGHVTKEAPDHQLLANTLIELAQSLVD